MKFRAFFKYFGAKHQAVEKYIAPEHATIVEPFAGSAAYATRWHDRRVLLVEKDPVVASVWDYLIRVKPVEVRRLPVFTPDNTHLDDLKGLPPEAKALVGFWLYTGSTYPRVARSTWAKTPEYLDRFWGPQIRERIASQVDGIKHWRILEGSYQCAPNVSATWFIDPPYQVAGKSYVCSAREIDYGALANWVYGRKGTVVVCENVGAAWLPFKPHYDGQARRNKLGAQISKEAVYMSRSEDSFDAVMNAASAVYEARKQLEEAERHMRFLLDGKVVDAPKTGGVDRSAAMKRAWATRKANQLKSQE